MVKQWHQVSSYNQTQVDLLDMGTVTRSDGYHSEMISELVVLGAEVLGAEVLGVA